jgi:hypothetical protein
MACIKITVFWDVVPCNVEDANVLEEPAASIMKETDNSPDVLVLIDQTLQHHIPEDYNCNVPFSFV